MTVEEKLEQIQANVPLVYQAGLNAGGGTVDQTFNPESANAQSGVAVAEAIETNNGSILGSVKSENLYDGNYMVGLINQSTGAYEPSYTTHGSIDWFELDSTQTQVTISSTSSLNGALRLAFYNAGKVKVFATRTNDQLMGSGRYYKTYTIPENAVYFRFSMAIGAMSADNNVMFAYGELYEYTPYFEPYTKVIARIDTDTTLSEVGGIADSKTVGDKIDELNEKTENIVKYVNEQKFKSTDTTIEGARFSLKQNGVLVITVNFTEFTSLVVGFSSNSSWQENYHSYLTVDNTNLLITRFNSTPQSIAHGLTISDTITVIIDGFGEYNIYNDLCKITVMTNGGVFEWDDVLFKFKSGDYIPFNSFTGVSTESPTMSYTCKDINKPIWYFGDSYMSYAPERFNYYNPYRSNALWNGRSGAASSELYNHLVNLLGIGCPKYVVWASGMNDGSGLSSAWTTNRDKLIALSEQYGFEVIFCTIPSVPTISHEAKNEWIRESGYRYVDYAKAVGATADGIWYTSMLSNDGVHPNVNGAIALCSRLVLDFTEIAIGDR